jgi:hypothetical protein
VKITKLDAAGMQLDAAIEHFLRGEWVPAIHCAGAAEELCGRELQRRGAKTLPDSTWETHDFTGIAGSKKEFVAGANLYRDWVKHTNDGQPNEIELGDWHVLFYLMRALNSYGRLIAMSAVLHRESTARFWKWFAENEARIEKIVESLPDLP